LPKVVNLSTYRAKEAVFKQIMDGAIHLYPLIEDAVDTEITRVAPSEEIFDLIRNSPQVNLSVVTSLCFALSKYMSRLIEVPNEFQINKDTAEDFVVEMFTSMMIDVKRETSCLKVVKEPMM